MTQISKYSWKKASCLTLFPQFSPISVYDFVIWLRRKTLCIKRGDFLKYLNHSILTDKVTLNLLRTSIFWLHIGKCKILFINNLYAFLLKFDFWHSYLNIFGFSTTSPVHTQSKYDRNISIIFQHFKKNTFNCKLWKITILSFITKNSVTNLDTF